MSKLIVNDSSLVTVADAIRDRGGTSAKLSFPSGMVNAINALEVNAEFESSVKQISESNADYIVIPKTNITKPQFIYLSLFTDDEDPCDLNPYEVDDPEDYSSAPYIVLNLSLCLTSQYAVQYSGLIGINKYGYLTPETLISATSIAVTNSSSSITIDISRCIDTMYFYGRYACEILGY